MDPNLHSPVGDSLRPGAGAVRASADGAYTVTIRFPAVLAGGVGLFDQIAILSRRSPLKEGAVLGPFHVSGRKPGIYLRLDVIRITGDAVWRRLPYLDRFSSISSRTATSSFCASGAASYTCFHPSIPISSTISRARSPDGPKTLASAETSFSGSTWRLAAPLPAHQKVWFSSRNFRLAVSHAIRRDDLCRVVYRGHAAPGIGPFPPANLSGSTVS